MGDDASIIHDIVSGKHPLSKRLENAKRPVIIVGVDQLGRPDGEAILAALYEYGKKLSKGVSFTRNDFLLNYSNIKLKMIDEMIRPTISGMECI